MSLKLAILLYFLHECDELVPQVVFSNIAVFICLLEGLFADFEVEFKGLRRFEVVLDQIFYIELELFKCIGSGLSFNVEFKHLSEPSEDEVLTGL